MKRKAVLLGLAAAWVLAVSFSTVAQPVFMDEAYTVARNWIAAVIEKNGDWGGSESAEIEDITEFRHGGKTVGYFCKVLPRGFIIVSLRRELAPVKAYSARSDLDPEAQDGLAELLKSRMDTVLNRLEHLSADSTRQGSPQGSDTAPQSPFEIDYREAWDALQHDPDRFIRGTKPVLRSAPVAPLADDESSSAVEVSGDDANYQEGQILLSSDWHQGDPYNRDVPAPPAGDDCTAAHCAVGCVATAGAQIMNYWKWPPYGVGSPYSDSYDWPNMLDSVTAASPTAAIDAVAELSHEVGVSVGMSYCLGVSAPCASTCGTYEMEAVYENDYRYSNVYKRDRSDYTVIGWFDLMKEEFNWNRPVQYRIEGHSMVGDGWQEIGDPVIREYHMNYGWLGGGSDTWYSLDGLPGSTVSEEYLLENIRPVTYLLDLSTDYPLNSLFPYRYFYRDTWGSGGTFDGGQRLQFLPGVFVFGTGASSAPVTFASSPTYHGYLFTRGDLGLGIRIVANSDGSIKLYNGGGIRFP